MLRLTWYTVTFRTLNESRRLEPSRHVNGAMWELITAGYANIITIGIRKLVDNHSGANSVLNVLHKIERHPEFHTREFFVCHDGLPFETGAGSALELAVVRPGTGVRWLPTTGPTAFEMATRMHETFDSLCGRPRKRKRSDSIDKSIFTMLRAQLKHPSIEKVRTMVDKTIAHAERRHPDSPVIPVATYQEVDEALSIIVQVCESISWYLLAEGGFGSVVPDPQFDVLEALDEPWCLSSTRPALQEYWDKVTRSMDEWASAVRCDSLSPHAVIDTNGKNEIQRRRQN